MKSSAVAVEQENPDDAKPSNEVSADSAHGKRDNHIVRAEMRNRRQRLAERKVRPRRQVQEMTTALRHAAQVQVSHGGREKESEDLKVSGFRSKDGLSGWTSFRRPNGDEVAFISYSSAGVKIDCASPDVRRDMNAFIQVDPNKLTPSELESRIKLAFRTSTLAAQNKLKTSGQISERDRIKQLVLESMKTGYNPPIP